MTRTALGELPKLRHRARGIPEPLVELVDRMLSRDPRLRPFDGAEVARALRALGDVTEVAPVLAATRLVQGRTMEALATAEDAMTLYRELGFCSHCFGTAPLLVVHIECLLAAGQPERARDAAADAKAWLLDIADKIGDPRYRATFLEAVPEHRRILELAEG